MRSRGSKVLPCSDDCRALTRESAPQGESRIRDHGLRQAVVRQ